MRSMTTSPLGAAGAYEVCRGSPWKQFPFKAADVFCSGLVCSSIPFLFFFSFRRVLRGAVFCTRYGVLLFTEKSWKRTEFQSWPLYGCLMLMNITSSARCFRTIKRTRRSPDACFIAFSQLVAVQIELASTVLMRCWKNGAQHLQGTPQSTAIFYFSFACLHYCGFISLTVAVFLGGNDEAVGRRRLHNIYAFMIRHGAFLL